MGQMTLDVGELFISKYKELTVSMSNIELEEVLPFELDGTYILGKVETKPNAPYGLVLYCYMSEGLVKQIVSGMSNGKVSSRSDTILYITEYINIVGGRAVSGINNFIGQSVRFSIPEITEGIVAIGDVVEDYKTTTSAFFKSNYGEMILKVAYTIDEG
ncbi:hypothetical protein [Anaerosporobacter sp.]|uniref:hypothetical protein n=1 Tax=Anaerosporobacter sp. TaxID=1872529 RepID=UPI00286F37AA|nr:hypothetical protein [Anaerosporobacter sp.]